MKTPRAVGRLTVALLGTLVSTLAASASATSLEIGKAELVPPGSAAARGKRPAARLEVSADRVGAFLYGGAPFRGDASYSVELVLDPKDVGTLDPESKPTPAVFGLEMVLVPEGAFWVGDPDPAALD